MISHPRRKWIAAFYFLVIPSVDPQMAMYPMYPPPPPPPMHFAVPMPVPMPIVIRERDETTTSTTTTESSRVAVAFPLPMPMPMQVPFAFPAFPAVASKSKNIPKNGPPCPPCLCYPSCTPAFFSYCSPCHKKCRCRFSNDTPVPIPPGPPPPIMGPAYGVGVPVPPMFAPPPVVVVPLPPPQPLWRTQSSSSGSSRSSRYSSDSSDTESSDDSSSSSNERRGKRRRRRKKQGHMNRRPIYRKHFGSIEISDNELVKPVLTYLSKDGDVKLKRRLSNDEAAELINEKPYQKIHVKAENEGNMPRVLITSQNVKNSVRTGSNHRRRQVVLAPGSAQHMLGEGKKELVFRPPGGKKISNLSVSFQISE